MSLDTSHHNLPDDKLFSVYYRVYAEDGAIPSANHVYSDDPYLGRILAELVSPPHTAISLKHCLFSVENINNETTASLFIAASSQTPIDDASRLSILAYPGPGCTPSEPMAFVAKLSDSCRRPLDERKPEAVLLPSQAGPTPFETRYSTRCKELKNFHLTDQFVQYTIVFINNTAPCYQRNPPTLINPPSDASALTSFHPLIPPNP